MSEPGKRRGLGRGLRSLIPQAPPPLVAPPDREVRIDAIAANPWQPRRSFNDEALAELSASIGEHGVLQPLLVRKSAGKGSKSYELMAGERRLRAARAAGLDAVPVVVCDWTDREALEIGLVENLQREDLDALEEATGYRRLIDEFALTQEEVATRVGKSRPAVANALRLLALPDPVREDLRAGRLTAGHARTLLALSSSSAQLMLSREVVRRGLSVRQLEALVRARADAKPRRSPPPDVHLADVERQLSRSLGTRVRLAVRGGKGRIVIEFFSAKERERLIARLR